MDQHMQQLSTEGVNDTYAIIKRMMGVGPPGRVRPPAR